MNYENMTDFEINRAVAEKECISGNIRECKDTGALVFSNYKTFNPCNDWADAGPIIEANFIDVTRLKAEPLWFACKGELYARNKNPLRAAMIVYLQLVGYVPE